MSCPPRRFTVFSISRLVRSSSHQTFGFCEIAGLPDRMTKTGLDTVYYVRVRARLQMHFEVQLVDVRLHSKDTHPCLFSRTCALNPSLNLSLTLSPNPLNNHKPSATLALTLTLTTHRWVRGRPQSAAAAAWQETSRAVRCDLRATPAARKRATLSQAGRTTASHMAVAVDPIALGGCNQTPPRSSDHVCDGNCSQRVSEGDTMRSMH